jgi:hypothetical protein
MADLLTGLGARRGLRHADARDLDAESDGDTPDPVGRLRGSVP